MKRMIGVAGRYGNGAYGHQHTREMCASQMAFVWAVVDTPRPTDVIDALCSVASDDLREERAACVWLNLYVPLKNHTWGWRDGDFGLWSNEEDAS